MIHWPITLPWAVEPDERKEPVAQAKPAPSNVVAGPVPPPDDWTADDIGADPEPIGPEVIPPEVIAPEPAAPEGAAADEATSDDGATELDEATLALELEGELVLVVVLLSLPQALTVRAPAARKATSPVIRVIFTQSSVFRFLGNPRPTGRARHHRNATRTVGAAG